MTSRRMAMLAAVVLALGCGRRGEAPGREEAADAAVSAPSRLRDVAGQAMLVLDSADERRLDLVWSPLAARAAAPRLVLTGEVVPDSSRTSVVRAPIAGRLSIPEGAHWPAFGEYLKAGALVGQVSDARPLSVAVGGVVTRLTARPGELVDAGQALLELTDFSSPLVRVTWTQDAPAEPPAHVTLSALDRTGPQVDARLHGPALEADPLTRLPAWLYRASRTWPGARPGLPVAATLALPGQSSRAVFVPDAAVVQWDGLAWAFRREGDGRYVRVRVTTGDPVPGGWLVSPGAGLAPGDTVVVRGAQVLLSEEFKSRVRVGDEVAE